jgi:hypothetical protein
MVCLNDKLQAKTDFWDTMGDFCVRATSMADKKYYYLVIDSYNLDTRFENIHDKLVDYFQKGERHEITSK